MGPRFTGDGGGEGGDVDEGECGRWEAAEKGRGNGGNTGADVCCGEVGVSSESLKAMLTDS